MKKCMSCILTDAFFVTSGHKPSKELVDFLKRIVPEAYEAHVDNVARAVAMRGRLKREVGGEWQVRPVFEEESRTWKMQLVYSITRLLQKLNSFR